MTRSSKLHKKKSNKMRGGFSLFKKKHGLIDTLPLSKTITTNISNLNIPTQSNSLKSKEYLAKLEILQPLNKNVEKTIPTYNISQYDKPVIKKKILKKRVVDIEPFTPPIEKQIQTYHPKPKIILNPSLDVNHIIKENNINKIMNKTKNQNETLVSNISLIGNEIDNLKPEIKDVNDPNDKVKNIIKYLETHIQELTISRAKLLYNSNDNEARTREQKKKSFFNKFKKNKNTVKNTSRVIINKQYYYRLLLETNFIIKIIKEIDNVNEKIDMFDDFFTFLETDNKKNNYTIEELKQETENIEKKYKGNDRKFIEQNSAIINDEIKQIINRSSKPNDFIGTSKEIIIPYLSQLNKDIEVHPHINTDQYKRLLLEHKFIAKIITDVNDFEVKIQVLLDFIKFIKKKDNYTNNFNNRKYNYNIEDFKTEIQKIETEYKQKINNNYYKKEIKKSQSETIKENISVIDNEIKNMKAERTKINKNNYKTINKIGIFSEEIYRTIIKYLTTLNNNMKDNMQDNMQDNTQSNMSMTNEGEVLDHTFVSKIITDEKINADKDKKLVLLFKFIKFIENAKEQGSLNEIHDIKTFEKETDKMINKYIYGVEAIDNINRQLKYKTKTNTQKKKNENKRIEIQRIETQRIENIKKEHKKLINNKNEERYKQFMLEQKQLQNNASKALIKMGQNKVESLKRSNTNYGIKLLQIEEFNLSNMKKQMLTKEYLRQLFVSILDNNTIKTLNLSGSLNIEKLDDDIFNLLLTYIKSTITLEILNISKCYLNYIHFTQIVNAMVMNSNLNDNKFKMSKLIFDNNNIIPHLTDYTEKASEGIIRDFNSKLQNLMTVFNSLKTLSFRECSLNNNFLREITRWLPNTSIKEFDFSFNDETYNGSINDTEIMELVKKLKEDNKYKNTDDIIINFRDYFNISTDTITNTNSIKINYITIIANDKTIETIKTKLNL